MSPGGELVLLWNDYRAEVSSQCPICFQRNSRLGISAAYEPRAYQLWCGCCGWRSAWFEASANGDIALLTLDPISFAESG